MFLCFCETVGIGQLDRIVFSQNFVLDLRPIKIHFSMEIQKNQEFVSSSQSRKEPLKKFCPSWNSKFYFFRRLKNSAYRIETIHQIYCPLKEYFQNSIINIAFLFTRQLKLCGYKYLCRKDLSTYQPLQQKICPVVTKQRRSKLVLWRTKWPIRPTTLLTGNHGIPGTLVSKSGSRKAIFQDESFERVLFNRKKNWIENSCWSRTRKTF